MYPRLNLWVWPSVIFLVPGSNAMRQSMLENSYPGDGLVRKSNHWSTLWVGYNSPSDLDQDYPQSQSIWINKFLTWIKIYIKASSNGTTNVVTTDTDISSPQAPWILPDIDYLVVPTKSINGGRFTTGVGLSVYILYFWISPLAGGTLLLLPVMSVITSKCLLTYFTHHFTYRIK